MTLWILLLLAGVLLVWSLTRERFSATNTIKAPPYTDTDALNFFFMLSPANQEMMLVIAGHPESSSQAHRTAAGKLLAPTVSAFFTEVFTPATEPLTENDIGTFLNDRPSSEMSDSEGEILSEYFIKQSGVGVGTSVRSGYDDALAALGQSAGYGQGPSGTGATGGTGAAGPNVGGGSSTGATGGTGAAGSGSGGGRGGGGGGRSGTGGTGAAGGGVSGRQVFGPLYTSLGSPFPLDSDPPGQLRFPELIGGMGDTTGRNGPGGARTSAMLPSMGSLGTDFNSGYLPYSRVPGDQDIIPDPYRLTRNYSTSSYTSKTDPVPFLTNFSAFFR